MTGSSAEDTFLTVAEVAERLKVNPQTVYNWIDAGRLRAVRVGHRRIRVRQSDFERFAGVREAGAPQPYTGKHPAGGAQRTKSSLVGAGARDQFLGAALDVMTLMLRGRPADVAGALRTLAARAEAWATELDE